MGFKVDSDLKRICANYKLNVAGKKYNSPFVCHCVSSTNYESLYPTVKQLENDDKYNTKSRRYSIFMYLYIRNK